MADQHGEQTTVLDSGQQQVGTVYAKALLAATEATGTTDAVVAELDSLAADVLDRLPKFEAALASPRFPHAAKERMLDQAFKSVMTPQLLTFLKVVSRRNRLDCLRAIAQAARQQHNDLRGRVAVTVKTAEPIGAALSKSIAAQLTVALGHEVDMTLRVDPELIGGMVVRVGDTVYDGSLSNRLTRMRDQTMARIATEIRDSIDRFAAGT